ncbi:hypothetical protein PENANT_c003G10504 [Penicillium antarcticum]|uniref:Uncharacterized protein n=1 Tax=Penicillium antarcticum TaxID=416450 RepID=A0A1V6QHF7_9EURO|nr:uncharacterized protein N7508_005711 [Penicillium antarcticum]KAJ5306696.1 hypothetical protein N7508_005711 [Penicillium antarcticum]OQD88635.1 hypothetical protein PENANT_c003G10504 [Penicillium antarcticum]
MERRNSTSSPVSPSSPANLLPRIIADLLSTTTHQPYRNQVHPYFQPVLDHLQQRLSPLVSVTTEEYHPDFPETLLAYNVLTMEQLDDLARHFHQVYPPLPVSKKYPFPIQPWIGTPGEKDVDLETRRRRFGKFIGLQGCESPIRARFGWEQERDEWNDEMDDVDEADIMVDNKETGDVEMEMGESEKEMLERMEREWQDGLGREWETQGHLWNMK